MSAEGFLSLLETHVHLAELFSLHQQAVLIMRWPLAIELFESYRTLLTQHIEQEEQTLMPLFERAGAVDRAPRVLFTGQHRKLFVQLDRIATLLASIHQHAEARRGAIEVLDLETAFKHLVEHHEGAEATYFYPTLERVASQSEEVEIVKRCWQEWTLARDSLLATVARAQQTLNAASAT